MKLLLKWLQDVVTNSGQPTLVLAITSIVVAAIIVLLLRGIFG
jgi:hypothetical protein